MIGRWDGDNGKRVHTYLMCLEQVQGVGSVREWREQNVTGFEASLDPEPG